MAEREEIVETLMTAFVGKVKKWNSQNYPYYETYTIWDDHIKVLKSLTDSTRNGIVCLRKWQLLNTGRIATHDTLLWEEGKWVVEEYDPRMKDPEYKKYLELKKRFENDS